MDNKCDLIMHEIDKCGYDMFLVSDISTRTNISKQQVVHTLMAFEYLGAVRFLGKGAYRRLPPANINLQHGTNSVYIMSSDMAERMVRDKLNINIKIR